MGSATTAPDITVFLVESLGAMLFAIIFLFLWRQSKIVYFGLWSAAWALQMVALMLGYLMLHSQSSAWLAPYAVFEFGFAILLISAARAGFSGSIRDWRSVLRLIAALPLFVVLVFAFGWNSHLGGFHVTHALVLCVVYFYNFNALRKEAKIGGGLFRASLLLLSLAFLVHAVSLFYFYNTGLEPHWPEYVRFEAYYDFALNALLAFSAMAMWIESQKDRILELGRELAMVRRQSAANQDLDHLTGLLNQSALARRVESAEGFGGVVTVLDMDGFKEINDRYGHLVGDEILRNIGHLLRSSIRGDDEAYRWGGDEFVILFNDPRPDVARKRMSAIEGRLRDFRVRGFGILPIGFSWGTSESNGRPLREPLDEADHRMYELKRARQG